jgi:hypothetical protein
MRFVRILLATGALAVLCVAQEAASKSEKPSQPAPAQTKTAEAKTAKPAAVTGGLVAVKDPETGEIRAATPAEIGAATAPEGSATQASTPAQQRNAGTVETDAARRGHDVSPKMIYHPNGAVGMKLGDENQVFSVVTKGPDGKLTMECVTGKKAATQVVQTPAMPEVSYEK